MKQLCCYVLSFRPSISLFGIELKLVHKPLVNYMKACGCWMGLLAFLTTKKMVSYGPSALDVACCFSDAFLALSEGQDLTNLSQSIKAWSPQIHLNLCKSSSFHHFFQKKSSLQDVTERQRREKLWAAKRPNSPKEPIIMGVVGLRAGEKGRFIDRFGNHRWVYPCFWGGS